MDFILDLWHLVLLAVNVVAVGLAGGHVVMYKRDSRAAMGWLALIVSLPILGALLYLTFGINRIFRRAEAAFQGHEPFPDPPVRQPAEDEDIRALGFPQLETLAAFGDRVTHTPLCGGNRIEPLTSTDKAFAAMLEAIDSAELSLSLQTYIFDHDEAGLQFLEALGKAVRRGVEVRVLIDAVGDRYTRPPMHGVLEQAGVQCAVFMPTLLPRHIAYANLRNHRKLMVADGRIAFTGGMNIRQGHADDRVEHPLQDFHFMIDGPVVSALQRVFAADWSFTTGEMLIGPTWFPEPASVGPVIARVIDDGPAENLGHLRWTLLGALACAQHRIRIVTPYFLPDEGLITAINMAVRRGVDVEILIPEHSNLLVVQWACRANLWQVLQSGCRILLTPRPFDHSKLMVIDGAWSVFGSANWDPRSLRLNFELNLEAFCPSLAAELEAAIAEKRANARPITLEEVDSRPIPIRFRDGLARLLTPYL